MDYLILLLIVLFWLDYKKFKKECLNLLVEQENKIKDIQFPDEWRELRELEGASKDIIDKEIERMAKKRKSV